MAKRLATIIAAAGQRQNGVMRRLRDGVARAVCLRIRPIGLQDALVSVVMIMIEPVDQCWPDVEADAIEVAGSGIGLIAFGGDLLVEIVIRLRAVFVRHLARERILARWLIKMAVNSNVVSHVNSQSRVHNAQCAAPADALCILGFAVCRRNGALRALH